MSYDALLAKSPTIIFRPGAPASGTAVPTWAEVQAFVQLREGDCTVVVDTSIAPAHVPAASGVTDFLGRGIIEPYRQDDVNFVTLTVDNGATLKGLFGCRGTLFLELDSQGTPSLDFDYSGGAQPQFWLWDSAQFGNAATATTPCIEVPAGQELQVCCVDFGGIFVQAATALLNIGAGGIGAIRAFGAVLQNSAGGPLPATWASGAGSSYVIYDSSTVFISVNIPLAGSAALNFSRQSDTHLIELTFNASVANVLAGIPGVPSAGSIRVDVEGFGGTGGGGGGQGGTVGAGAGVGGGGAGGCQYQRGSFTFDLSHQLNVTVGAGGAAGAAGAAAGGAGGDGGIGSPSVVVDVTAVANLASLAGSSGGGGGGNGASSSHGGASYPGAFYPKSADIGVASGQGFVAAGGFGGNAGLDGTAGQKSFLSLSPPGAGVDAWSGGAGGAGAAGGGGGGGGGAGPLADGGLGGAGGAGVGVAGASPAANTGGGPGGGGGGGADGSAGGAGGAGAAGWVKLSFLAY